MPGSPVPGPSTTEDFDCSEAVLSEEAEIETGVCTQTSPPPKVGYTI